MLVLWQSESPSSNPAARLWGLNCLLTSGAELMTRAAAAVVFQDIHEDTATIDEQTEWALTDPNRRRDGSWAQQIDKMRRRHKSIIRKVGLHRQTVKAIRRELRRTSRPRAVGRGGSSYKSRKDRRLLSKRLRSRRLPVNFLRKQRAKVDGIVRVRLSQARRLLAKIKRAEFRGRMARNGYEALAEHETHDKGVANPGEVHAFWQGLWEVCGDCNPCHLDIRCWGRSVADEIDRGGRAELSWECACAQALDKLKSWKAPGPDGIAGYWYKKFPEVTDLFLQTAREIIVGDVGFPHWFVRGRTVLIPKVAGEARPDQFRPITCLNTGYKLLTGALCAMLRWHVEPILPEEQKALRVGKRGCLDAL